MRPTLRPVARSAASALRAARHLRGVPILRVLRARSTRGRAVLSVVMLLGVLGISAGAGYHSSQAVLGNASAYLPSGHGVAHVNATTGRADAQLDKPLATGHERLETAQTDREVYTRNGDTNEVSRIDTSRMAAAPVVPGGGPTNELVTGGTDAYVVEPDAGFVSFLDPQGGRSTPVRVDGKIVGQVADSKGTAWILLDNGNLRKVHRTELATTALDVCDGGRLLLTLLHDRPVVVCGDAGRVVVIEPDEELRSIEVDLPDGKILPSVPSATAGALWLVVEPAKLMLQVDTDTGRVTPVSLGDGAERRRYGRPVEFRGRVYVPDLSERRVLVFDATTMRTQRHVELPPGGTGDFDVTTSSDRIWINDQYAATAVTIGPDGSRATVGKGDSPGLRRPNERSPAAEPSAPPTTPTTSPRPGISGHPQPTSAAPSVPTVSPRTPTPDPIPKVTIPDVLGLDKDAACAALTAVRLECRPVAVGQNGRGPTGSAIGTDPPAGNMVQERYVVIVRYRDQIEVPDLVGMTAEQACTTVRGLGLACLTAPQGLAADATALNVVTGQQPAPAQRAETGEQVTVTFPNQIAVPKLDGTPIAEACARLGSLGIATCRQADLGSATSGQTAGVVIRQTPAAGTGIAPTDPVTLEYYGGAQQVTVPVPNLVGMSPDQAQTTLAGLGLAPVPVSDEATNQPNVVHSQDPAANSAVAPGTQVRYVYEDAAPTPLYLHKRSGEQYYLLSTDASVPGYSNQRSLGNVFPASGPPPGGGTAVYRYRCDNNACGPGTTYYFSMTNTASVDPAWVNDGIAFYAYAGTGIPAGTQEIKALYHPSERSWVWAVNGSAEYNIYINRGHTSNFNFSLGWAWS